MAVIAPTRGGDPPLVIFDCDGVLVDSEPISCETLAEALCEIGLPLTPSETMQAFMGRSMKSVLEIVAARRGEPVPEGFVAALQERTFAAFRTGLEAMPGIHEALDLLERTEVPTCVASSGDLAKMRFTLGLTRLLPRFDGRLFSATQVARGKPHPDVFLYAAERMGQTPERCIVVEDSPLGVQGATAAGMRAVGFAPQGDGARLTTLGAMVIESMHELPGLLEDMTSRAGS